MHYVIVDHSWHYKSTNSLGVKSQKGLKDFTRQFIEERVEGKLVNILRLR